MAEEALTFIVGDKRLTLNRADLQRFPDSVLQGLCSDVKSTEPITIDVTNSLESPFAAWDAAVPLTVGVYRHGFFPIAELSEVLKTHTAPDLITRLTELCDYLGLPVSPLTKLLPDRTTVPLMYAGVHGLCVHALVTPAVNCCLLSSTAFTESGTQYSRALAMFCVIESDAAALSVYAVTPADAEELLFTRNAVAASAWRLDSMGKAGSLHTLYELHTASLVSPPHHSLGAPFGAALRKALEDVPVGGRTGVMRVDCVEVSVAPASDPYGEESKVHVWVVRW